MKKGVKIIIAAVVVVVIIVVAVVLGVVLSKKKDKSTAKVSKHPENQAYRYTKAAVASDAPICSKVGIYN